MPETIEDDDQPKDREATEADILDDEDIGLAEKVANFQFARLRAAIRFVQKEVPPYGIEVEDSGQFVTPDVPPAIGLVRNRALIAAYGLIEREFARRDD